MLPNVLSHWLGFYVCSGVYTVVRSLYMSVCGVCGERMFRSEDVGQRELLSGRLLQSVAGEERLQ